MNGYTRASNKITGRTKLDNPMSMSEVDSDRDNVLSWSVSCNAPENSASVVADGDTYSPSFSTGDGPWDITVTVTNDGNVPITVGATVTEESDTDTVYAPDDTGFGGELQPGGTDSFTVAVTDGGAGGPHAGEVSFILEGVTFNVLLSTTITA